METWGDVPTWVGAVGTLGAVFWAVFLYRRSLRDSEREQARLLAPVGGVAPIQVLPGTLIEGAASGPSDLVGIIDGKAAVIAEANMATVRLVSTSNEAFSDVSAALLMEDGREEDFMLGFDEIAPHEGKIVTNYYRPGVIAGNMRVRLRFQDANGRRWERINGEPVSRHGATTNSAAKKWLAVAAISIVAALGFGGFVPQPDRPWVVALYAAIALGFGAVKTVATIFEHDSPSGSGAKLRTTIAVCDIYAFVFAVPATVIGAFTFVPALQKMLDA